MGKGKGIGGPREGGGRRGGPGATRWEEEVDKKCGDPFQVLFGVVQNSL